MEWLVKSPLKSGNLKHQRIVFVWGKSERQTMELPQRLGGSCNVSLQPILGNWWSLSEIMWMEEILHPLGTIRFLWNTVKNAIIMGETIYKLVQDFATIHSMGENNKYLKPPTRKAEFTHITKGSPAGSRSGRISSQDESSIYRQKESLRVALWVDCVSLILKLGRAYLVSFATMRSFAPPMFALRSTKIDIPQLKHGQASLFRWHPEKLGPVTLDAFQNPLWICWAGSLITLLITRWSIPNSIWLARFQQWVVILVIPD